MAFATSCFYGVQHFPQVPTLHSISCHAMLPLSYVEFASCKSCIVGLACIKHCKPKSFAKMEQMKK